MPRAAAGATGGWYLNMSRRQIEAEIVATCAPYAEVACPPDNETAYGEWAAGDPPVGRAVMHGLSATGAPPGVAQAMGEGRAAGMDTDCDGVKA